MFDVMGWPYCVDSIIRQFLDCRYSIWDINSFHGLFLLQVQIIPSFYEYKLFTYAITSILCLKAVCLASVTPMKYAG